MRREKLRGELLRLAHRTGPGATPGERLTHVTPDRPEMAAPLFPAILVLFFPVIPPLFFPVIPAFAGIYGHRAEIGDGQGLGGERDLAAPTSFLP